MSLYSKVYNVLVTEGRQASAKQMANWFNTTPATVAARVSEVRQSGFAVYANKKFDSQGRTATYYRVGNPTRAVVAAGIAALRGSAA
jgi:predicted ArsR family transcriptional regulator